ncbi:MAG: hypothetical protein OHK0046_31290 [Anaerolineae bacterium]
MNLQSYLYSRFSKDPEPIIGFLEWLVRVHHLPSNLAMLDIGCGTGDMLRRYADLGWHVTGMEPDPDFFQSASEVQHPCVQVVQGGFGQLSAREQYDLITVVNDPFAYLLTIEDRIDAMQRMYRALRPGGVLFMEIKNFFFKLFHHEPFTQEVLDVDGRQVVHLMQHEIDFHHAYWIHRDEYIIEGQEEVISKVHRVAMISPSELFFHAEGQGFENVQTYNNYSDRRPETLNGNLILLSAVKPHGRLRHMIRRATRVTDIKGEM